MNKSDTIKELRRRARDGEIGIGTFFDSGTLAPCCTIGHAVALRFGRQHGFQLSNTMWNDEEYRVVHSPFDVMCAALEISKGRKVGLLRLNDGDSEISQLPNPSAAVEIIAEEWGVE